MLLQLFGKLWNECRPVFLDVALAHECDALKQDVCELVVRAAHEEADEVLLQHLEATLVDKVGRIVLIFAIFERLLLFQALSGGCGRVLVVVSELVGL